MEVVAWTGERAGRQERAMKLSPVRSVAPISDRIGSDLPRTACGDERLHGEDEEAEADDRHGGLDHCGLRACNGPAGQNCGRAAQWLHQGDPVWRDCHGPLLGKQEGRGHRQSNDATSGKQCSRGCRKRFQAGREVARSRIVFESLASAWVVRPPVQFSWSRAGPSSSSNS